MLPLDFIDAKPLPAEALQKLRAEAPHLIASPRGIAWDPWWRRRRGYQQDAALDDTHENRAQLARDLGSDALIRGMGLLGLPWGASLAEICASVAKWAAGALVHIVRLEELLATERAGSADLSARLATETTRSFELAATVAALREDAGRAEACHAEEARVLRAELAGAEAARRMAVDEAAVARAQAEAWRLAAESAKASAEAAAGSLDILRAALRVPVGESGAMVVSRG